MPIQYWLFIIIELFIFIIFSFFSTYSENVKFLHHTYGMFQDIHVMIFVGFGFLMIFLKKYGYSSLGFNFLVASLMIQWSILCEGFFNLVNSKIEISLMNLYNADIATATVLISMGVILGCTTHFQLIIMGFLEILAFCINSAINKSYIKAADAGGSVLVHAFGAYFGLAVSYILNKKSKVASINATKKYPAESSYSSNIFAMFGTLFLWIYWPSFNAIDLKGNQAQRAIINTYLSLSASCVTTFIASHLLTAERENNFKINIVHIQNSTLAGGVAIGATVNLIIQPYGAILIGILAALVSVYGYVFLTNKLERFLHISDTCGVHNLHGIPGILGGIFSIIFASFANEKQYGRIDLYEIYPARINATVEQISINGRSALEQAGYQSLLLLITVLFAILSGILTGIIVNLKLWGNISADLFHQDNVYWEIISANEEIDEKSSSPIEYKKLYNKTVIPDDNISII